MSPSTDSSSSSDSCQRIKLTTPTPNFEECEFEAGGQSPDDSLHSKIQDLIRDLPSPLLSLPLPTFSNSPTFTSQWPTLSFFDSSKLSALVTNSFRSNQLLCQVINLLQNLLFQIGSRQTAILNGIPTTLPLTFPTTLSTSTLTTLPLSLPTTLPTSTLTHYLFAKTWAHDTLCYT